MPNIFDQLNAELDGDEPGGITPLDIADLPTEQRQVLLALLRDQAGTADGVPHDALHAKLGARVADLDATLALLVHEGWLIALGEAPNQRYRVNLRAKRGSSSSFGLWSVLSDRLPKDRPS